MEITNVRIRHLKEDGKLKATVSITFDNEFALHDIKIIEGQNRFFLAMPSKKMPDGTFRDTAHPITQEMRQRLEDCIIEKYKASLEE